MEDLSCPWRSMSNCSLKFQGYTCTNNLVIQTRGLLLTRFLFKASHKTHRKHRYNLWFIPLEMKKMI